MAEDLNFKHTVQEIPQGEQLPKPYQRQVSAEVTSLPDFQGAVSKYASDSNWMSVIGSQVASTASNVLASKLGGESGKNPHGDIGVAFTDFDKNFKASYDTQAQSVLSVQAQKLISDSNIELAKAPRIDAGMIAKANQGVNQSLQKIYNLAPDSVRPNLEHQYQSVMIQQNEHLMGRMLTENRQDMRDNTLAGNKVYAENAHSLAIGGDEKGSMSAVKAAEKDADAAYSAHVINKQEYQTAKDTAHISMLSGKYTREMLKADSQGKRGEFEKKLALHPPEDIAGQYHDAVLNNVASYIGMQDRLRSEQENYVSQEMHNRIALDPNGISGTDWATFESQVSPLKASQMQFNLIQALKAKKADGISEADLIRHWDSAEEGANASEKIINSSFNTQVANLQKRNPNLSHDAAQVQVAMSAGFKVPVFEKDLENKLVNGNPVNIQSAVQQMQMLDEAKSSHVYSGISAKAKAIGIQFMNQRGTIPDTDLARKITDNLSNIDDTLQKTLDNSWQMILSTKGAGGLGANKPHYKFALEETGINPGKNGINMGGSYFAVLYGNDIYNQLQSNFTTTRGDYPTALKMTQSYVDEHYGETTVNGGKQITDSPIEKYLGYKSHDVTPFIHQDLLNHLSANFELAKAGHPDDYWQTEPLKSGVAEVTRHVKTKDGMKVYRYPVNLLGRAGNQWDVVVQTPQGPRNLFLVAPNLGITTYQPDKKAIDKAYMSHPHGPHLLWI